MIGRAVMLALVLAASAVAADDAAIVCQATIESGARRLFTLATDAVDACAHRKGIDLSLCLGHALKRANAPVRRHWATKVRRRCAGVEVTHDLGYLDSCVSPGESIACDFAIAGVVVRGKRNDLLDCLACQVDDRVLQLGRVFLPTLGPLADSCQLATTASGLTSLRSFVDELAACLEDSAATSIARCLADDARRGRLDAALSSMRTAVAAGCAGTDPFATSGYPPLCARFPPAVPPLCGERARVCNLPLAKDLDLPGYENDLLDCFACQVEEAAVGFAHDVYGSNVCCTGTGCPSLRSRAACRRAGGRPVHYRVDTVDDTVAIGGAHGVAVAADGSLLFATTTRVLTLLPPGGAPIVLPAAIDGFPSGVAFDPAGNAFVAVRQANQISRTTPDGTTSIVAGTGMAGHAGDGGPATAALVAGPDGVAADAEGNVFFTESGAIALLYGTGGNGEYVRMVDPLGVIHTIAGNGDLGTTGADGPAMAAALSLPYSLALTDDGTLLIGEAGGQRVLRLDRATGLLHHVAGRASSFVATFRGDDGPALAAQFSGIEGIGQDRDGKIFVADFRNRRVRIIDRESAVATVAGRGSSQGLLVGAGALATGGCPAGLAVGGDGRIYFADLEADRIRVLTAVDF